MPGNIENQPYNRVPAQGSIDQSRQGGGDVAQARPRMVVGTFHKTGTVLMLTILREISRQLGYKLALSSRKDPPDDWQIYFHPHSAFPDAVRAVPHRGVVVIRDPRDVIISGAHYHCRTDARRDPWLYEPDKRFEGRSYHEAIAAEPTEEAKLVFEMRHHGNQTLLNMKRIVTPPPGFILTRLEDLSTDHELTEFRRIFTWLGIPQEQMPTALGIAEAQSLFSGSKKLEAKHIRSGRPAQWREHFTPLAHEVFLRRFGDLPERLGYPSA
jgi:hypothetical protein